MRSPQITSGSAGSKVAATHVRNASSHASFVSYAGVPTAWPFTTYAQTTRRSPVCAERTLAWPGIGSPSKPERTSFRPTRDRIATPLYAR